VIERGSHLCVRRGVGYSHHGIAINSSEVVEFGGGLRLLEKQATTVRRVSLESFQRGGDVKVVRHPITHMDLTYSSSLPPGNVVDRAEWLIENQPPAYRLGYRNCESIAIWCKTGDFENFQAKRVFAWGVPLSLAAVFLQKRRSRLFLPSFALSTAISLGGSVPYIHSRALFDHTRRYPGKGNW
jgi:Lecithin retinol acyltransferase